MVLLAVVMFVTNPREQQHVDRAMQALKDRKIEGLGLNTDYLTIGEGLVGKDKMDELLKKFITRKNYYLFSLTEIDLLGDKRIVGLGIFGHIFSIDDLK